MSKKLLYLAFLLLVTTSTVCASEREDTVCGFFQERFLFWLWSSAAPEPDPHRIHDSKFIEPVEFVTSDNKKLKGYKYNAHNDSGLEVKPKGYVLMALGNAMISDQIIDDLKNFSLSGLDVYIYDYRGYGNSEGRRRINALIEDYNEIVRHFNKSYEHRYLYGISLGGAILMNVIGSGVNFDAAVIDSSPSRFSEYGCPKNIDPIENLPHDARKLLVITGDQDEVLGQEMVSELREEAERRGATIVRGELYSHPFMDRDREVHNQRLNYVLKHFIGR